MTVRSRFAPLPLAWCAALPLAALLAACGGGGGSDATAGGTTAVSGNVQTQVQVQVQAAGPTCSLPDFQAELLRQVNALRAAGADCGTDSQGVNHGVFAPTAALAWNDRLTTAAAGHSTDMQAQEYFSHDSLDGRKLQDRIDATGYTWSKIAENIAAGQDSVTQVMTAWRNSPGHCSNLMDPELREIGVACVSGKAGNTYSTYWTMDLGRPR